MPPLSVAPLMTPPESTLRVPPARTIHPPLGDPEETAEVWPLLTVVMRCSSRRAYAGEPVTVMAAQDIVSHKAWGDVTADLLTRLGIKVDYAAVDWGTVVARRAQKSPPSQGGWHIFHTDFSGVDCVDPTNKLLRAHGDKAWFGWPSIPLVEAEIAAWYDTKTLDEE